jgi:hypothetical protein
MKAPDASTSAGQVSELASDDVVGGRRSFFRSFAQRVARSVPNPFSGEPLASFHTEEEAISNDDQWMPAAPVHSLGAGALVKIPSPMGEIEIRSTALGYRATLGSSQTIALRSGRLGWIEVNPALHWPSSYYLSNENLEMRTEPSDLQGEKND